MPSLTEVLAQSGANAVGRTITRGSLSVLAHHGVPDEAAFARLIDGIGRHHTFVSPDAVRAWLTGDPLPPNPVLVSFDDGDPTVLSNGAPVLAERNIEALIFVVAGLIGTATPFWWDEVAAHADDPATEVRRLKRVANDERVATIDALRSQHGIVEGRQLSIEDLAELVDAGFEVGNHSFDHPCLDRCDEATAVDQIERCHQTLLSFGLEPRAFAYPNGNLDTRIEPALERLGYDLGFLFDHRHANARQPRLRLSRLRVDADAAPERATVITSGVHGSIMRLRRRG